MVFFTKCADSNVYTVLGEEEEKVFVLPVFSLVEKSTEDRSLKFMDHFRRKIKKKSEKNTSPQMLTKIALTCSKTGQEHLINGKFLWIREECYLFCNSNRPYSFHTSDEFQITESITQIFFYSGSTQLLNQFLMKHCSQVYPAQRLLQTQNCLQSWFRPMGHQKKGKKNLKSQKRAFVRNYFKPSTLKVLCLERTSSKFFILYWK